MYEQRQNVAPGIDLVLAHNPSPMTHEGTNSYVLQAPGAEACVIVDPGPDDEAHLAVLAACGPVEAILLTHGHPDHAGGATRLGTLTGAPIRVGSSALHAGGFDIHVVPTPGHTADSVCFAVPGAVLTGDTILGRGTSVLGDDDGALRDYLGSLHRLSGLSGAVLPGHGPVLPDIAEACALYIAHRTERIEQVRAAVAELGEQAPVAQIVQRVYADVDPDLWPVAEHSVRATVKYLRSGG